MKQPRSKSILFITAAILLIPAISMQFTNEVHWTLIDFIVAGLLLLGLGFLLDFISRKIKKSTYRITIIISIIVLFFLLWAELAVGLFGTPFAGN